MTASPELAQLRARLGRLIVRAMDARDLTPAEAASLTGIASTTFAGIRRGKLRRLSAHRMMTMLDTLGEEVRVTVTARSRNGRAADPT